MAYLSNLFVIASYQTANRQNPCSIDISSLFCCYFQVPTRIMRFHCIHLEHLFSVQFSMALVLVVDVAGAPYTVLLSNVCTIMGKIRLHVFHCLLVENKCALI